jgi:predicted aldo/keto reductase-like oxidoreductase
MALGNAGDYEQAINVAQPIANGRALSAQAQEKIALWSSEIEAEKDLEEARYLATQNTADSLVRAIDTIRQIPSNTRVYYEVVPNTNDWSRQILNFAQNAAYSSLEEGIAIARKIPSGTASYPEAQALIERWSTELNPPPSLEKREKFRRPNFELEKTEKEN